MVYIYCKPTRYSLDCDWFSRVHAVQDYRLWKAKIQEALFRLYLVEKFIFQDVSNYETKWIAFKILILFNFIYLMFKMSFLWFFFYHSMLTLCLNTINLKYHKLFTKIKTVQIGSVGYSQMHQNQYRTN